MSLPFENYSELQDAIAAWLINRTDLVAEIPWFIRMAEASFNRKLRTRQMINRSRVVAAARYVKLPSDWRKAWNIQRVEDNFPLDYLSPAEMDKKRHELAQNQLLIGGSPVPTATFYSFFGDTLELLPSPTEEDPVEIEMLYYGQVRPLTDQDPTNWLLTAHPDLYLYGALVHTAPFLKEDERIPVWKELFNEALAEANAEDADAKRSGAPMTKPKRSF